MFSWKKQNPPSQQRQQQAAGGGGGGDYSDLIAHGMRLANEDIDESGDGGDYMGGEGDEDLGDMDLDDPDLLAELQGLTGEAPAPRPKPAAGLTQPPPKAAAPPAAAQSAPARKPAPAQTQPPVQLPAKAAAPSQTRVTANPALAGLGLDLDGAMEDDDDEEVELTEDDWNDPHFMAQLQSLGGHAGGHQDKEALGKSTAAPTNTEVSVPKSTSIPTDSGPLLASNNSYTAPSLHNYKPASASSSMIGIPPQDKAYSDEDMDGDSLMTDHTKGSKVQTELPKASSPTEVKPPKRVETIPKTNHRDLLKVLQTREAQYKRAAVNAKQAGNMDLARERMKVYKSLQGWIGLVEKGGFLDLEIYPIPDEPPAATAVSVSTPPTPQQSTPTPNQASAASPAIPSLRTAADGLSAKPYSPPISTPASEPTTQVSSSIAEASGEDMRAGSGTRGLAGIQFTQLKADDDFKIVSNSDADTYDMLESQLESQIKMCDSTLKYYYQIGDKTTALEFHKLNKTFKVDLVSLQSHRSHGKRAPAFHFQDVRFELEHGFYQEIGLNDLSLNIVRAWDLSHKDVQPSDMDAYVTWDLGWPTESMAGAGSGKGTTPSIKKTTKPDYNYSKTVGIERTRGFQRFVERRKATFEVWHYRGLLWKDYLIGRGQIALQPLMNHSELLDPSNRKNTGGKLEIKIRLQRPLLKPEIVVKEEKWLVIDEFNSGGLGFPSTVAVTPPSRSSGSPAVGRTGTPAGKTAKVVPTTAPATRTAVAPAPVAPTAAAPATSANQSPKPPTVSQPSAPAGQSLTPAAAAAAASPKPNVAPVAKNQPAPAADAEGEESESDKALNELNSVELLVSNMVLESEIQIAQQMVHDAKAVGNTETAEEYQDRLMQLEIKMKLLVLQVQTGQLTMDVYCRSVYDRIGKDKKLAVELKRLNMVPEAKRALGRSKIMAQEMKEVEEAMAAQGEEDEEQE
ncbi:Coiled-coil and C2 domain-containing protein 1B [Linnemannia exigua]|uniref:Coiled-coil and C2 domain-containing protein 1B n=1 Tax=Linnemannia exigua TaxID=604196 RepID=A0AAD4DGF2_9FUNG|nr:Coiled-coil and C2 domain-containing protein 1B [Linnemannia exigua]